MRLSLWRLSLGLVFVGTVTLSCQAPPPFYPPSASAETREVCQLTERRCTECHDRDRIVDARKNRNEWAATIERMRQMPGSTIRPDETEPILRCLLKLNDTSDQPAPATTAMLVHWIDVSP